MVNAKDVFIPEGTNDPTAVKAFSTISPMPGELWSDNTGKNRLIIKAFEGHCVVLLLMDAPLRDTTEITADGKIYYINTKMPTVTLRKAYGEKIGTLTSEDFEDVLRRYAYDQDVELTITAAELDFKEDKVKDELIDKLRAENTRLMDDNKHLMDDNTRLMADNRTLNYHVNENDVYKTMYDKLIDKILSRAVE